MLITAKSLNTLKLDYVGLSLKDNAILNVPYSIAFLQNHQNYHHYSYYAANFKRFLNYITEIQTLNSSDNLKTYNYKTVVFLMGDRKICKNHVQTCVYIYAN